MKTLLLSVILILAMAPGVQGQWRVGGMVDINRAHTAISPEPEFRDYMSRLGFGLGFAADFLISNRMGIHGELLLQGKGNTIQDEDFDDDLHWKTSWVEIPLLFRYTLSSSGTARPYVAAGPSIGFLRSAKFSMSGEPDQDDDDAKSMDASVVLGGGATFPLRRGSLFGELRYVRGLVNVVGGDSEGVFEVRNRGLQLVLGMTFPVGQQRAGE